MKIAILVALVAFAAAEPEADADAYYGYSGLYGLGYGGYGYAGHLGYAGYGYGYPYAYGGYASHSPSAAVHIGGLAAPAVAGGYAAAGRYVANSAGVVHV